MVLANNALSHSYQTGSKLELLGFEGVSLLTERLQEMGLHKGLEVIWLGQLPFGGPYILQFGATVFALRQEEVQCLKLKAI